MHERNLIPKKASESLCKRGGLDRASALLQAPQTLKAKPLPNIFAFVPNVDIFKSGLASITKELVEMH